MAQRAGREGLLSLDMFFTHQEPDHRIVDRMRRAGRGHRGHHPGSERDREDTQGSCSPGWGGSGSVSASHDGEGEAGLVGPWGCSAASAHTC